MIKRINSKKMFFIIFIVLIFLGFSNVYADNSESFKFNLKDYSKEYKDWLNLPEEIRKNTVQPRIYSIPINQANKREILFKSSNTNYYNLKDIIPQNIVVKNQMQTNSCWAFSSIAALESTLGLQDYLNGNTQKVYDFSERHMDYATSNVFLNDEGNKYGFNRTAGSGGNPSFAFAYLTNGMGAINEEDMPFENNTKTIALSEIQNKTVTSRVKDIIDIPSAYNDNFDQRYKISEQIKDYLQNNGGVVAALYGAKTTSEYYNSKTGAMYCDNIDCLPNHQVLIIGWDDDYSVNNFNLNHRPSQPGAWIIKNSWGTSYGKNGIAYVSYEDVNIYYWLVVIQNASDNVDYDNIYQYNELGHCLTGSINGRKKLYLLNQFEKKTDKKEFLTGVSIYAPEKYNCRVYINIHGKSKLKENLNPVDLKEGLTKTIDAGYHTLEFATPVEILSDDFLVVVEIQSMGDNDVTYSIETNDVESEIMQNAEQANGKCFITDQNGFLSSTWYDMSDKNKLGISADSTIKAYSIFDKSLGDVNNDKKINQKDAKLVLKAFAGKEELTDIQKNAADVNNDGKINQKDAKLILKYYAGKIDNF